jgi:predicted nucleic acid-binding protein
MSGNSVFVDTNIVLYFLRGDAAVVEMLTGRNLIISFITELEVLAYPTLSAEEDAALKGFLSFCNIIDINPEVKKIIVDLRKKYRLKLPDAMIAATAIYSNLPLITADKQFGKVSALNTILYEL